MQQAQATQAQAAQGQMAYYPWAPSVQPQAVSPAGSDQQSLASAFSTVSLNQPATNDWFFDSGATSHMTSDPSTLTHNFI